MTHQQLIDFWRERIQILELSAKVSSTSLQIDRYSELAKQARQFYMQLCQMETKEPITITSTD